jgi:hypothetical protein
MTRFGAQLASLTGGPSGAAVAGVVVAAQTVASSATAVGSDLTNQMGVGHTSWHPDQNGNSPAGGHAAGDGYADPGEVSGGPGEVAGGPADPPTTDQNANDWGRPLEAVDLDDHPDGDSRQPAPAPRAPAGGAARPGEAGVAGDAAAVPIVPA